MSQLCIQKGPRETLLALYRPFIPLRIFKSGTDIYERKYGWRVVALLVPIPRFLHS